MSGYWDARRAAGVDELFQTGAEVAADWRANRQAKQDQERFKQDYALALEAAKKTGKLDPRFQRTLFEDDTIAQSGLKEVLLRELAKVAPNHPLVKSVECRASVGDVTKLKFNLANRPPQAYFDEFAPNEDESERIFDAYK